MDEQRKSSAEVEQVDINGPGIYVQAKREGAARSIVFRYRRYPELRQSGRTTKQMIEAPRGAFFVWPGENLGYPRALAAEVDRDDLQIVGPSWLRHRVAAAVDCGLVVDHAAWSFLNAREKQTILWYLSRGVTVTSANNKGA